MLQFYQIFFKYLVFVVIQSTLDNLAPLGTGPKGAGLSRFDCILNISISFKTTISISISISLGISVSISISLGISVSISIRLGISTSINFVISLNYY